MSTNHLHTTVLDNALTGSLSAFTISHSPCPLFDRLPAELAEKIFSLIPISDLHLELTHGEKWMRNPLTGSPAIAVSARDWRVLLASLRISKTFCRFMKAAIRHQQVNSGIAAVVILPSYTRILRQISDFVAPGTLTVPREFLVNFKKLEICLIFILIPPILGCRPDPNPRRKFPFYVKIIISGLGQQNTPGDPNQAPSTGPDVRVEAPASSDAEVPTHEWNIEGYTQALKSLNKPEIRTQILPAVSSFVKAKRAPLAWLNLQSTVERVVRNARLPEEWTFEDE
ncbi:unnamed protein product [Zymoseptoria tritici ST99CH_1A5]|uniref:Uncharacterized protein n=1 Tax=Zymoseptoria tritici ST99CH_1A5 TaxID=1276529 RepID=A0A1Y6LSF3_ZYMTR|nr:unnamed protein product [Zymoseptoria tritici ST99CH_1A5]